MESTDKAGGSGMEMREV